MLESLHKDKNCRTKRH